MRAAFRKQLVVAYMALPMDPASKSLLAVVNGGTEQPGGSTSMDCTTKRGRPLSATDQLLSRNGPLKTTAVELNSGFSEHLECSYNCNFFITCERK